MRVQKNTLIYCLLIYSRLAFALAFMPFAPTIIVAIIFALGISYWLDNIYIKYSYRKQRIVMTSIFFGIFLLVATTFSASIRLYDITVGAEKEATLESFREAKKNIVERAETARKSLQGIGIRIPPVREDTLFKGWTKFAKSNVMSTLTQVGAYLSALTDIIINILVFAVFVTVMVRRRKKLMNIFSDVSLWGDLRIRSIYFKAQQSSYGSVFTIFTTGIVQTLIMTMGARFAGFEEWSIILVATFFASFFPVLGTAPVGVLLSAIKFFQGDTTGGLIMLFIAGFVGIADNWIKPYIVTHSGPRMNAFIALVGIVGAVMIFGLPGLFIGPFLMIFVPRLKTEGEDLLRSLTKTNKATTPIERAHYQSSQFN